jgi:beta-galactosidase GanA
MFDFSLFDETIAQMASVGIRNIFCTPTATPPCWLTRDHPEVLAHRRRWSQAGTRIPTARQPL